MSFSDKQAEEAIMEKVITTHTNRSVAEGQIIVEGVADSESKRVLRRIDMIILPLMGFCYMLQFMDKLALSQATLLGLREDLVSLRFQLYSRRCKFLTILDPSWNTILLVLRHLLLRLSCMELAKFLFRRPLPNRQIPLSHRVPLGRFPYVPRRLQ